MGLDGKFLGWAIESGDWVLRATMQLVAEKAKVKRETVSTKIRSMGAKSQEAKQETGQGDNGNETSVLSCVNTHAPPTAGVTMMTRDVIFSNQGLYVIDSPIDRTR